MKKLFQKIVSGVAVGCFGFVTMLFIGSAVVGNANVFIGQKSGEELLQLATYFIVIAVGYFVPSLIYKNKTIANSLKVLIHMTTGTVVYLITAYFAGWMGNSFGAIVIYILIALVVAGIFWAIIFLNFKQQADKMNKKIKEKKII